MYQVLDAKQLDTTKAGCVTGPNQIVFARYFQRYWMSGEDFGLEYTLGLIG